MKNFLFVFLLLLSGISVVAQDKIIEITLTSGSTLAIQANEWRMITEKSYGTDIDYGYGTTAVVHRATNTYDALASAMCSSGIVTQIYIQGVLTNVVINVKYVAKIVQKPNGKGSIVMLQSNKVWDTNITYAEVVDLFDNCITSGGGGGGATNLSFTRTATTLTVVSDTGNDAILPAATTSLSGVLSAADKTKLDGLPSNLQQVLAIGNNANDQNIINSNRVDADSVVINGVVPQQPFHLYGTGLVSPTLSNPAYAPYATFNLVNDGPVSMAIDRFSTNSTSPHFNIRKSRGTSLTPLTVNADDEIGNISFWGHNGTNFTRTNILLVSVDSINGLNMYNSLRFGAGTSSGSTAYYTKMSPFGKWVFSNTDASPIRPTETVDIDGTLRVRSSATGAATTVYGSTAVGGFKPLKLGPGVTISNDTLKVAASSGGTVNVSARLTGNGVTPLDIAQQGAMSGQALAWNGSAWAPATIAGGSGTPIEYCTDTITQASHGFSVGTPIRHNGTSWVSTIGAYGNIISATGVVVKSITSNQFVVANCGSFPTVIASGSYYQIDASPGYGVVPDTLQVPLFKVEAGQMFVNPVFGITAGETLNFVDGSSVDFTKSGSNVTAEITGFNSATNGYVPSKNGTSVTWIPFTALPSGTNTQTLRYNGTTLEASSVIQNNGTNAGIGTTPDGTFKVSVAGGIVADNGNSGDALRITNSGFINWSGAARVRGTSSAFVFQNNTFTPFGQISVNPGVPHVFSGSPAAFTRGSATISNSNFRGALYIHQNANDYDNGICIGRTTTNSRNCWSIFAQSDSTLTMTSFYMPNPGNNIQTALTNRFGFAQTGQLFLYNYTSASSFTGTVVGDLGVTSGGAVVTKSPLKMREENFTATATQTDFTIAYSAPAVSGTNVPIRVYRNGVRLFYVASGPSSTQFTFTGTTVTTSANTEGDIITIEYLN